MVAKCPSKSGRNGPSTTAFLGGRKVPDLSELNRRASADATDTHHCPTAPENVICKNIGLSNVEKSIDLRVPVANVGGGSFKWSAEQSTIFNCKVTRLDKLISSREMRKVRLIKIDVEGFELSVLEGSQKTLLNGNAILTLETFLSEEQKAIETLLTKFGYIHHYDLEIFRNWHTDSTFLLRKINASKNFKKSTNKVRRILHVLEAVVFGVPTLECRLTKIGQIYGKNHTNLVSSKYDLLKIS